MFVRFNYWWCILEDKKTEFCVGVSDVSSIQFVYDDRDGPRFEVRMKSGKSLRLNDVHDAMTSWQFRQR